MKNLSLLLTALLVPIFLNGMEKDQYGWIGRWFHYRHKEVPEAEKIPIYKTLPEAFAANHYNGFRKFLKENPIEVHAATFDNGNTLLHWAIQNEKVNVAAAIMMERGDKKIKNKQDKTPEDLAKGTKCECLFAKIYASEKQ